MAYLQDIALYQVGAGEGSSATFMYTVAVILCQGHRHKSCWATYHEVYRHPSVYIACCAGSHPVAVYFSNPDLLWAAQYSRPRFGQGAFSTALDALHRQVTGTPLPNAHWFGKPNLEPYR